MQDRRPALTDHEMRLRILEEFPDVVEVLSATMPPVEEIMGPREAVEMAKVCNDEMADLVARNPKKYIAAIANLPLNDMDATLKEAERAIKVLGFKGVQVHTRVLGKPLSHGRNDASLRAHVPATTCPFGSTRCAVPASPITLPKRSPIIRSFQYSAGLLTPR